LRITIALGLQLAALASFLIWGFNALFAPMLFAGENNAGTWLVFTLFLAMPVLMVFASIAIWVGYAKHNTPMTVTGATIVSVSFLIILLSSAG